MSDRLLHLEATGTIHGLVLDEVLSGTPVSTYIAECTRFYNHSLRISNGMSILDNVSCVLQGQCARASILRLSIQTLLCLLDDANDNAAERPSRGYPARSVCRRFL